MTLSEIISAIIVIALLIERHLYSKEMNKQLIELSKLVKAKDSIEYATAKSIVEQLEKSDNNQSKLEFVPYESISDEEFFDNIKKQLNPNA